MVEPEYRDGGAGKGMLFYATRSAALVLFLTGIVLTSLLLNMKPFDADMLFRALVVLEMILPLLVGVCLLLVVFSPGSLTGHFDSKALFLGIIGVGLLFNYSILNVAEDFLRAPTVMAGFLGETAKLSGVVFLVAGFVQWMRESTRKERELNRRERLYRGLVESQNDLIVRFNPEGRLTYVNDAFCGCFGRSRSELLGHEFFLFKEDERGAAPDQMESLHAPPHRLELQGLARTAGGQRWISWDIKAVLNEEGSVAEIQGVGRDITPIKRANEAMDYQQNFQRLVAEISSSFISVDKSNLEEKSLQLMRRAGEFRKVDRSIVFEFSPDGKKLSNTREWCRQGVTPARDFRQDLPLRSMRWWAGELRKREPIVIDRVDSMPEEARAEREELKKLGIKSLVAVPILNRNQTVGWFGFEMVEEHRCWDEDDVALLKVLANILADAGRKLAADQHMMHLEYHDPLTGLYNRKFARIEMQRIDVPRQYPLSVVLCHVEKIEQINENEGFKKGDETLTSAAEVLRASTRYEDVVARWGGDAFLVVLPQTDREQVQRVCERVGEKAAQADVSLLLRCGTREKEEAGTGIFEFVNELSRSPKQQ